MIFSYCINGLINPDQTTKQSLVLGFVVLLFFIYVSIDLLKVFSLKIMENGIEKKYLIFRTKQYIPFDSILSIDKQKAILRSTRGINISNGYHISVVKFKTGKNLIISPDSFENYENLILAIKTKIPGLQPA
jgi:hypothetical protein